MAKSKTVRLTMPVLKMLEGIEIRGETPSDTIFRVLTEREHDATLSTTNKDKFSEERKHTENRDCGASPDNGPKW